MLEGLVSWILKTYIGKYVNVNQDKLSIGLLSGVVELENASLKLDALNKNERFPFSIKFGHIGKIKLNISFNTLRNSPWSLVAENINIVLGPKVLNEETDTTATNGDEKPATSVDFEREKLADKLDRVTNLENKWFKEVELLGEYNENDQTKSKLSSSYLASFAYSLLSNLQVSLNGIHIRYEDSQNGFGIGANVETIFIKNDLSATSDPNDPEQNNLSYKLFEVINFCLYTNTEILIPSTQQTSQSAPQENSIDIPPPSTPITATAKSSDGNITNFSTFSAENKLDFVIEPTSFQAQLARDMSPRALRKRRRPRIRINTTLDEFAMNLSQTQLEYVARLIESLNVYHNRMLAFSIPRPLVRDCKLRWRYLFACVKCHLRKPLNWPDFISWSRDVNSYSRFHFTLLNSRFLDSTTDKSLATATVQNQNGESSSEEKNRIEREWTFDRLLALRRAIFENFINKPAYRAYLVKIRLENKQLMSSSNMSSNMGIYGYLSWRLTSIKDYYFATGPTTTTPATPTTTVAAIEQQQTPVEEHDKIDDEVIGLINDTLENDNLFKRDSLLAVLEFKLKNASLLFSTSAKKPNATTELIKFKFENSLLTFEALPRHDSFQIECNLGSFFIYDCLSKTTSIFPALVYPKSSQLTIDNRSVFKLSYEHKPVNKLLKTNSNLTIKSCGLDIVYHRDIVERLVDALGAISDRFKSANMARLESNESVIKSQVYSKSTQQNSLGSSRVHNINFDFEITAPKIILPHNYYSKNPYVFIFDFGRLTFLNRSLQKQKSAVAVEAKHKRRNSDSNLTTVNLIHEPLVSENRLTENNEAKYDEEDDQDDVFATPMATPPNEYLNRMGLKSEPTAVDDSALEIKKRTVEELTIETSLNSDKFNSLIPVKANDLYSNYDLNLSELQVICGKFITDNLAYFSNKGHSSFHLLEKFDIDVQISIFKLSSQKVLDGALSQFAESEGEWPSVKIGILVNLLKLNIDNLKITNFYRMMNNLKSSLVRRRPDYDDTSMALSKSLFRPSAFTSDNGLQSFLVVDLRLSEIDMAVSVANIDHLDLVDSSKESTNSKERRSSETRNVIKAKSLCELKLYQITSTVVLNNQSDVKFKLSLCNMLIIDACQIYGTDYQLLAASHNNILLDTRTGMIVNRTTGAKEDLMSNTNERPPLVNIELEMKSDPQNGRQLSFDTSFSSLDIVLNPETISELCIFAHSIFFNISLTSSSSTVTEPLTLTVKTRQVDENENLIGGLKSNIRFRFDRLSVLMFQIEDEYLGRARKIASLALDGVSVEVNILPEIKYLDVVSKIEGLNVSDLSRIDDKKRRFVFGVSLEDRISSAVFTKQSSSASSSSSTLDDDFGSTIFELTYKQQPGEATENQERELSIKIASLCYVHSPKFIFDLQSSLKTFTRFYARIVEEIADNSISSLEMGLYKKVSSGKIRMQEVEPSENLAMSVFNRGKNYLKNTLVELYATDSASSPEQSKTKANNKEKTNSTIKIKMLLETPVISIPINVDSRVHLVAHLGQIKVKNEEKSDEQAKFKILLSNMSLFSVDSQLEEELLPDLSPQDAAEDEEKQQFKRFFCIFYKPSKHQKLIEKTDLIINLDHYPKSSTKNHCIHLNTRVVNNCKINLSKQNLEQIIQTFDNIVYKESVVESTSNSNDLNANTPRKALSSLRRSKSMKDINLNWSYFEKDHFNTPLNGKDVDLAVEIRFKIEKLDIIFLADVERPLQEIAELCFNEYVLNVDKHKEMVTRVKMSLKSLYLVDKLIDEATTTSSHKKSSYLLWTNSNVTGKHTCRTFNADFTQNLSFSLPDLHKSASSRRFTVTHYRGRKKKPAKKSAATKDILSNMIELTQYYNSQNLLSTSLPSEFMQNYNLRTRRSSEKAKHTYSIIENKKQNGTNVTNDVGEDTNNDSAVEMNEARKDRLVCPCTPPPSPTQEKKSSSFFAAPQRSESTSNLASTPTNDDMATETIDKPPRDRGRVASQPQECKVCAKEANPLVTINILLVDESHPNLSSEYNQMQKYIDIRFSRLKLNVNPETWILLLDLLGFGSKIYPIPDQSELEMHRKRKQQAEMNERRSECETLGEEALDEGKRSNIGVNFKVEQFTIQLNENRSNKKRAKIKINQVEAFIEQIRRDECLKTKGRLGSLVISDVSEQQGLYSDRLLTCGERALEFEFLKYSGPLAVNEIKNDFEASLKLKTSSFKYIHTQRFIVWLTDYFKQFNQLQDALGKMRALSLGEKNISYEAQRSSRIKLNINSAAPIILIPLNSRSKEAVVFNLGRIEIRNRFVNSAQIVEREVSSLSDESFNGGTASDSEQKDCLLDLIDVKFSDTHLYSAQLHEYHENSVMFKTDAEISRHLNDTEYGIVKFLSFYFKQTSDHEILKQQCDFNFHLERNLENEISHKSPDWSIYSKFSSISLSLDVNQYKLIRGILDQNLGEKGPMVNENNSNSSNFIIANPLIETVLTGRVWKSTSIFFELENVGIELSSSKCSLAQMSFIKSSLTYEGFSDGSKLVDLVSNEIRIMDSRSKTKSELVLYKKQSTNESRLQMEIHYRSNKTSNRSSILFNNCRWICIIDWLIRMKHFLSSNAPPLVQHSHQQLSSSPVTTPINVELPNEVKINLTNTDFVLVENLSLEDSEAIILRMTAFLEYNERRSARPIESSLQSIEVFSCTMNAIEETALSIIDPVMFSLKIKEKKPSEAAKNSTAEFIVDITTDVLRLRVSYLDLNFFLRVFEAIKSQLIEVKNEENKIEAVASNGSDRSLNLTDLSLKMENFCFCLIDDCNDIDVPLVDIQFNRFQLTQKFAAKNPANQLSTANSQQQQGSAEFALNIDYFNRLVSGWEPLVEPWLARFDWKLKPTKNVFTLTSMDVLNVNLTNTFIQLISDVTANWKANLQLDSKQTSQQSSSRIKHKIFQPYKLVNLTGQQIKFIPFQYTDTNSTALLGKSTVDESVVGLISSSSLNSLNHLEASCDWIQVEDKCEKQFSFFAANLKGSHFHSNHHYEQRVKNNQLRKLAQNRIRVKMDGWSEIRPLTVDKVGTYYREVYTEVNNESMLNMTRLIFEISLSGNAIKQIEMKSPVLIKNRLSYKLECRIESVIAPIASRLGPLILEIDVDQEVPVPIKYLPCQIWFRPVELVDAELSESALNLAQLGQTTLIEYYQLKCRLNPSFINEDAVFYFFAKVKRHQFPTKQKKCIDILGYSINIEPAFALYNLLPIEMRYKFSFSSHETAKSRKMNLFKSSKPDPVNEKPINGKIDSYKLEYFSNINVSKPVELLVNIENFRIQKSIEINPGRHLSNWSSNRSNSNANINEHQEAAATTAAAAAATTVSDLGASISNRKLTILRRVNFYDDQNRPLFLIARITFKIGSGQLLNNAGVGKANDGSPTHHDKSEHFNPCPIIVQISAIYCFFNLTGLPLIFRQYNCNESAGQLDEHEYASNNQPLLFSFNEADSPYACSMRIGKYCTELKTTDWRAIRPRWCKPFGLDSGSSFRALHVVNNSIVNTVSHDDSSLSESGCESPTSKHMENSRLFDADSDSSSSVSQSTSHHHKAYLNHDWVYYIGIEIKPGKGLLKDTTFVYFSTRYYLVNKSAKDLVLSQYYFAKPEREKSIGLTWRTAQSCRTKLDLDSESQAMFMKRNNSSSSFGQSSPQENKNNIILLKESMCQFHWPRSDFDQLLSVRIKGEDNYNWSGGFKIDEVASFYIILRNCMKPSDLFYLKVDVFLEGGTFYIVFSEKFDTPFPLRIENYAQVPVTVYQSQSMEESQSLAVKPSQTLDYTWDEPTGEKKIVIGVKGGTQALFELNSLRDEDTKFLYYESFIYIVFADSLKPSSPPHLGSELTTTTKSELVLTCVNNRIYLDVKESGNRAQLWSLTLDGYLIHEGSSPPREFHAGFELPLDMSTRYVLDIEDAAPRPNHLIPLTLRRPDMRRKNTQKWYFDKAGYLACNVRNMCLQVHGEFKRHAKVVLGPQSDYQIKLNMVKSHVIMNVYKEQLRPGSGHILVKALTDGPTRVLKLTNIKNKSFMSINWEKNQNSANEDNSNIDSSLVHSPPPSTPTQTSKSIELYVNLTGGIGISLIQWLNQEYEELFYVYLKSLELNFDQNMIEQKLLLGIQSIQVCNQLINAFRQNLLLIQTNMKSVSHDTTAARQNTASKELALKIDYFRKFRSPTNNYYQVYIEHLVFALSDVNLQIEERLLWKIIQFLGLNSIESNFEVNLSEEKFQKTNSRLGKQSSTNQRGLVEPINADSLAANYYKVQLNNLLADSNATKYSFNKLQINGIYMMLSVYKTPRLSNDLLRIKSSLGIPLIQFENARIECKPFILMNENDTAACILNLISKHYRQELRSNAIRILGSVDFLGNPLGLMVDFKESFSNVLSNGQVTDFVFSITHGVANSLSKFSGSLSDSLSSELTMDERHREKREQIRSIYNQGSVDHFLGGALGFAVGLVGGAFSMATQTYHGFNEAGVSGAFAGLGKGAVGTVSKPIVGVLDFANGIASAIRETSRTGNKIEVSRCRESRCCSTSGALLAPFSPSDANGQKILYQVNGYDLAEKYIALEYLKSSIGHDPNRIEQTLALVSNQRVIFVIGVEYEYRTVYEVVYSQLKGMSVIEDRQCSYLEMCIETEDNEKVFPRFKFENKESAKSLENKIRYAKADYDETLYTLHFYKDDEN